MFKDRKEAGVLLAQKLKQYKNKKNVVVIGLTRGGVVVSHIIAKELHLPHDILVVKKIGAPTNPELAIGAAGPENSVYWDNQLCKSLGIDTRIKNQELKVKEKERKEKEKAFQRGKPLDIKGKKVILVDDGVATGATVLASHLYLRKQKAATILLAVPVISQETYYNIARYFDKIVALQVEEDFAAVGQFYEEFPQVSDNEVVAILRD